jgi:hypothetical protein
MLPASIACEQAVWDYIGYSSWRSGKLFRQGEATAEGGVEEAGQLGDPPVAQGDHVDGAKPVRLSGHDALIAGECELRPSNPPRPRQAASRVSCTASSASCTEPSIR